MRIAAVTTWFPTERAPGSGVFTAKDVAAIAAHPDVTGVDVIHLVRPRLASPPPRGALAPGVRVRQLRMNPLSPVSVIRAGRTLAALTKNADVVHSMAVSTLAPVLLARLPQPWLHTEHWSGLTNPGTLPLPLRAVTGVVSLLLRAPQTVTAVVERLAVPIRSARYPRRSVVIGCVVPPPAHVPSRPMRPRVPMELVAVGALVDRKDPETAVRTIAELEQRGVQAVLTWVGDGPLRARVRRLARRLGVADRVDLVGARDADGVADALATADMFLLPTKGDNFCVAAAEALVHGRPVVVGAAGGQGEYLDPVVGQLVDEQTPAAYADAVVELDKRTQHLTGDEIAATIGDRFAPATIAQQYVQEYRHLQQSR